MNLKFSCADFTFPLLSRRQAFSLIRLLGFECVDLGLFERNTHLRTSTMLADPRESLVSLQRDLDETGLQAADVFLQIGASPDEASANDPSAEIRKQNREIFLRSVDLCCGLGCRHITGLPGVSHRYPLRDFAHATEETRWRVETSVAAGLTYSVEPHIGSICSDVTSTRRLLDAVAGLTLTLDYGHFIASGHTSKDVHPLLPYASHLHVRGGALGRLQTSVAENTIDFEEIVQLLAQNGYEGVLALEYVWIDWEGCNQSDTLSETILLRQAMEEYSGAKEARQDV